MSLLKLKAVLKAFVSFSLGRSIGQTSSLTGMEYSGPEAAATWMVPE
jgi:hypothetical protein